MFKTGFILVTILFASSLSIGQTVNVFDQIMLTKKFSQCDLISKYISNTQHYEFYVMDSAFYGITSEGNCSNISGNYNFAVRNDTLCQVYFMTRFPRSSNSLKSISLKVDSLLEYFSNKFGKAESFIDYRKDSSNSEVINGYTLLDATWLVNGDRLVIDLSFSDSENLNRSVYSLRIHRFRECYFDNKLSKWWKSHH